MKLLNLIYGLYKPFVVDTLVQIKKSLIDPKNHLRNWNRGDPCTSNWTGVWCFGRVENDGYFHVHELYGPFIFLFFHFFFKSFNLATCIGGTNRVVRIGIDLQIY